MKKLILALMLGVIAFAAVLLDAAAVTLAWNASTNPIVAGYNVYYGGASGAYTNELNAGCATNLSIAGLTPGVTYYFAATTYSADGKESPFSSEVSCSVLLIAPIMNYSNTYTAVVTTNAPGFYTNELNQIMPIPPLSTNDIFNGFWICYPSSGVWTLQSSTNLLTWFDYATGTNAVFIPSIGGNWFFRFKSP